MAGAFEQNELFLAFAQEEIVENFKRMLWRIISKVFQAVQLYCFWTNIEAYNDKIFCLHAILHTANIFRMTFDRNGSILLLSLNILIILMTFYIKSAFATIFSMSILSTFFMPIDDFL